MVRPFTGGAMKSTQGPSIETDFAPGRDARVERTREPQSEAAWLRYVGRPALVILAYVVAAEVGLRFASIPPYVTLVWPPAGIALAAVVLWGWRMAPAIGLAAFIVNASHGLELPFVLCVA